MKQDEQLSGMNRMHRMHRRTYAGGVRRGLTRLLRWAVHPVNPVHPVLLFS
ncbi:MAG TPA: hypothetical protein VFY16_14330 [Gemmatimonadaceae bacterium]|nr:hypothetical protein [Gemmatimonadaceae bacterium]